MNRKQQRNRQREALRRDIRSAEAAAAPEQIEKLEKALQARLDAWLPGTASLAGMHDAKKALQGADDAEAALTRLDNAVKARRLKKRGGKGKHRRS